MGILNINTDMTMVMEHIVFRHGKDALPTEGICKFINTAFIHPEELPKCEPQSVCDWLVDFLSNSKEIRDILTAQIFGKPVVSYTAEVCDPHSIYVQVFTPTDQKYGTVSYLIDFNWV